jgi:hypothetical protein
MVATSEQLPDEPYVRRDPVTEHPAELPETPTAYVTTPEVEPPVVAKVAELWGLGAKVVESEAIERAAWLAAPTVKLVDELVDDAYVEFPEYWACSMSVPTASADVTHCALPDDTVTAPHEPIVAPPAWKLTVPLAPVVTVAVSVTDWPKVDEAGFSANVTVEEAPGTTGMRGDDRRLYCEWMFTD